jgi:dTDP-glucose 4,6-dehydratase
LSGLRGGHILLTGCTGFFGKWLIETLLWADGQLGLDLRISVLTRDAEKFFSAMPHLRRHKNLLPITRSVLEITAGDFSTPCTHIVHGANLPNDGGGGWALKHMLTAVDGTRRLLELAREQAVASVLLLSSGAAYISGLAGAVAPFREEESGAGDYVAEPKVYAVCKYYTEMLCAAYGETVGPRISIARCFTFFGPFMPLHARQAVNSFFNDALRGRNITIQGDGTAMRSYMYAADLIIRLLALSARGWHCAPYNIGSARPVSVKDLAKLVVKISGQNLQVDIRGKEVRGNAPALYLPDTGRVQAELGLHTETNLEDALSRTWRWYRQHLV